jgi:hypothetical protein
VHSHSLQEMILAVGLLLTGCSGETTNNGTDYVRPAAAGGVAGSTGTNGGSLSTGGKGLSGGTTSSGGNAGIARGNAGNGGTSKGGTTSGAGGVGQGDTIPATGGVGVNAGSGGSTGNPAKPMEDEGADCTVTGLPELGSLTDINKLPDPFKKVDGTRIAKKEDWRCRREEIKQLAETFAFGTKGKPQTVTGTVSNTTITVNVSDKGKSTQFSVSFTLPTAGSAPYPAVVNLDPPSYRGLGAGADLNTIKAAGAAVISYDPFVVGKETGSRRPKQGAYYDIAGSDSTTGLLVAWGWGVSRIIDVIEQSDGKILRADGIGVTGCSRFGKGALLIGVFDQRIALTMPIESGTGGVPIWRNVNQEGAQTLSSAYTEQPWFGDEFTAFTSNPTKAPIDTHELIAMVAPRGLFIMDNPAIANLGPKSAHAAALAGAEVYKALGAAENITYWSDVQNGTHCAIRPEWKDPLTKNIQTHLLKRGSYTGVIKAASKATVTLSDWKDWETPTLK